MSSVPRRNDLARNVDAEHAIRTAVAEVEFLAADERLSDAVALLNAARESVADYVDGVTHQRRHVLVVPAADFKE